MSEAGTASSNSNARTSVNNRAFILKAEGGKRGSQYQAANDVLNEREPIAYARPWSTEEAQEVSPDSRHRSDGFRRVLPTLGSERIDHIRLSRR